MRNRDTLSFSHDHSFLSAHQERNEKRVWLVIALTAAMMVIEIAAGHWFGSMALIADGWHMLTHAGAMLIAVLAYRFARKNIDNRSFSFGTGKAGDLAGFASAILLLLIALLIGWESVMRLVSPVDISFEQAILVGIIGLVVNLACAWLLRDNHHHHYHPHDHTHHSHSRDSNLRAAYLHVLADALTSVLAIVALLVGRTYGWFWADPFMGVVGAVVITRWSWGLIRETAAVLLDRVPQGNDLENKVISAITTDQDRISDLHLWQIGPGHYSLILSIISQAPKTAEQYKARLAEFAHLSHITVEVHQVQEI
ncbi:CDF family Co(II)/Ni(II) efflux transporter DmeF [Polycladidibacter stylochi]|uniref:CDF family Co(II)/Ni(II) efflux transporter DmeF n=1 Tax=Polycladidibacter stylochi TaxID=1807766 RepID=UPI00082CAAE5|nr:CDF family Co(II)/Ni(II) efflux transporter DmeF [Pseudovibrio stylochi]